MRLAPWLFLALVGDLDAFHVTLRPEIGLSVDRVRFVRGILPLMKWGAWTGQDGVGSYSPDQRQSAPRGSGHLGSKKRRATEIWAIRFQVNGTPRGRVLYLPLRDPGQL